MRTTTTAILLLSALAGCTRSTRTTAERLPQPADRPARTADAADRNRFDPASLYIGDLEGLIRSHAIPDGEAVHRVELSRTRDASQSLVWVRGSLASHYHAKSDEIVQMISGSGIMHLEGMEIELRPGAMVRVPRGAVHEFENTGAEPAIALVTWCPGLDPQDRVPAPRVDLTVRAPETEQPGEPEAPAEPEEPEPVEPPAIEKPEEIPGPEEMPPAPPPSEDEGFEEMPPVPPPPPPMEEDEEEMPPVGPAE